MVSSKHKHFIIYLTTKCAVTINLNFNVEQKPLPDLYHLTKFSKSLWLKMNVLLTPLAEKKHNNTFNQLWTYLLCNPVEHFQACGLNISFYSSTNICAVLHPSWTYPDNEKGCQNKMLISPHTVPRFYCITVSGTAEPSKTLWLKSKERSRLQQMDAFIFKWIFSWMQRAMVYLLIYTDNDNMSSFFCGLV